MTRARRLGAAFGLLVLLLFTGRWAAAVLANRWWAAELSPAAASFVTQIHILRFVLKLAGVLIASAWFIGHLVTIYQAVGSVQIRRRVANIEIREALTARTLLTAALLGGTLLGIVVGSRLSGWWWKVVLAWTGVTYDIVDPLLGRDLGVYVAQLPLWRAAHGFFFFLVVSTLGLVVGLYALVGAIRWIDGRPAINDHARRHLGWLLLALGVALAWGYLLEPYELVAGMTDVSPAGWRAALTVAPVLAGMALAAGGLSAVWATQPRHALAAASWIVLIGGSVIGHWLFPSIFADDESVAAASRSVERLTRLGYALDIVRAERVRGSARPDSLTVPATPALWSAAAVSRLSGGDSATRVWADPALLRVGGARRPAWLVLRPAPGERDAHLVVAALAADRVGPGGVSLFYRPNDSTPHPSAATLVDVPDDAARPDAPPYRLGDAAAPGVPIDSWSKRIVLTWALQAGGLLGTLPADAHLDWHLSPSARLRQLAPFADWGRPTIRVVDGALVWIVDGYVTSESFPLAHRAQWLGRTVGAVQAGFVGVIDAETGATKLYLRPGAGPLPRAWAGASDGLIEPDTAIPAAILQTLPYPAELFRVQALEFERSPWGAGVLVGRPGPGSPAGELPRTEVQWGPDSSGPVHVAVYDQQGGRTVAGVLVGRREQGRDALRLFRLDSTAALPSRDALRSRWARFPMYDMLSDSVQDDGGRIEPGPVHYEAVRGGAVAYQVSFAHRPPDRLTVAWVSLAASGERLGAGRSFEQAWGNLLGTAVPESPGKSRRDRLTDARAWAIRADSAARRGDWAAFGQAWHELRRALGLTDSAGGRERGARTDSAARAAPQKR